MVEHHTMSQPPHIALATVSELVVFAVLLKTPNVGLRAIERLHVHA